MLHRLFFVLVTAATVGFIVCSGNPLSGVETTNGNTLVALLEDGSPAREATVRFVADDDWYRRVLTSRNVALDSARTDGTGRFRMPEGLDSIISIEVDAGSESALINHFELNSLSRPESLWCAASGAVQGNTGMPGAVVRIAGTSYMTTADESGAFRFEALPPCSLSAVIEIQTDTGVQLHFGGSDVVVSNRTVDLGTGNFSDTIPLSYFDREWMTNPLSSVTGGGYWFTYDDRDEKGGSVASHEFVTGYSGKALRMDLTLDAAISHPYGGFAVKLTEHGEFINLSDLKTLSFYARGTPGSIQIYFNTYATQTSDKDWDRFRHSLSVTEEWAEYTVPVDSLKVSTLDLVWSEASEKTNRISIVRSMKADTTLPSSFYLEIDNVRLVGARIDQLMKDN